MDLTHSSTAESAYLTSEHLALREQVARFLAREVEPFGAAWEEQGYVPREVLRKMGALGLFGITYPQEYGGAEADALTSLVFAEALSRSTFGGFVVTVLVHTDMASPASGPRRHARAAATLSARDHPRRADHRGRHHRAGCRLRRGRSAHARAARGRPVGAERHQDVHHQRRACRPLLRRGAHGSARARARAGSPCSSSRRARRASASGARSRRPAGCARTPPSWCSTTAASPRRTCWARRTRASTR